MKCTSICAELASICHINMYHFGITLSIRMEIFAIMRNVYMILDYILITLFKYSLVNGWISDQIMAKKKNQGHLMRILNRKTENLLVPRHFAAISPADFLLRHEDYIDPVEYVLNCDNVVLMGVSKSKVIYIRLVILTFHGLLKVW